MSILKIGDTAPDFTLFASDKSEVSLNAFRGKNVVLLFFPLAFTGVCTEELCSVRDAISLYNTKNAQILGISRDSVFVLEKYKEEEKLNYPLLSDFNAEVSKAYGTLFETFPVFGMKNVPKRSVFVINKQGKIAHKEILDIPKDLPDFKKVEAVLNTLD